MLTLHQPPIITRRQRCYHHHPSDSCYFISHQNILLLPQRR